MSAAPTVEPIFVTVDGFDYQVFLESIRVPHRVSKLHILHWKDGAAVAEDCPVSPTGENRHYFGPCLLEKHPTKEAAAIDAVTQLSDLARFEGRERRRIEAAAESAQFNLFG